MAEIDARAAKNLLCLISELYAVIDREAAALLAAQEQAGQADPVPPDRNEADGL